MSHKPSDHLHEPPLPVTDPPPNPNATAKGHAPRIDPEHDPAGTTQPWHDSMSRVAVVGAGVAGLTCARTLTDHGFAVTVFEKSRGPGGRSSTRRVEPNLAFDHGSQYFTATNRHFTQFVEALKTHGCVAEWGGRIVNLEKGMTTETSPQSRFVGVPGMSAVAAYLAADLTIRHDVHIERIVRSGDAWELTDATGKQQRPRGVLVEREVVGRPGNEHLPPFAEGAWCHTDRVIDRDIVAAHQPAARALRRHHLQLIALRLVQPDCRCQKTALRHYHAADLCAQLGEALGARHRCIDFRERRI